MEIVEAGLRYRQIALRYRQIALAKDSAVDGRKFENGTRVFETWQGHGPILLTETLSLIPLLRRWLAD